MPRLYLPDLAAALLRLTLLCASAGLPAVALAADPLPIADTHVHYSHDAWGTVPVPEVIGLMRKAGLRFAMVSSSSDEGTQRLFQAAPELVVPSLRPYRSRGEISSWVRDDTVVRHVEDRLRRFRYAAIGEFHVYGADADLPVPRRMVQLARQHNLLLHAHSDSDAIERLFAQFPQARVLWAHAGFERPAQVRALLRKHRTLWADPSFKRHFAEGDLPKYMPSPGTLPVFTQAAQEERYVDAWDRGPTAERVRIAVEHRQLASPVHAASWAWSPTALAAIQTLSRLMAEQAVRKSEDPAATRADLAALFARADAGS